MKLKKFNKKPIPAATVMLLTGALGNLAHADSLLVLEEIVVTAQKREASVQDVPAAVSVVTQARLESAGITDFQSLQQSTSGIAVTDAVGFVSPFIRGVGSFNIGFGGSTSVATYVDGFYNSRFTTNQLELGNVQQIEVLKGPQGALYGRNATGGAIVITTETPQPEDELQGNVNVTVGNFSTRKLSAYVGGGISDQVAGSLGVQVIKRDGFIDNLTPGGDDQDDRDSVSFNGKLVFNPSDVSQVVVAYNNASADDAAGFGFQQVDGSTSDALGTGVPLTPGQAALGAVLGQTLTNLSAFVPALCAPAGGDCNLAAAGAASTAVGTADRHGATYTSIESGSETDDQRLSLTASYSFSNFDFVSLTAWSEADFEGGSDLFGLNFANPIIAGAPPASIGFIDAASSSETITQEFQLKSTDSDIEWIVGLNYLQEDGTDNTITPNLLGLVLDETLGAQLTFVNTLPPFSGALPVAALAQRTVNMGLISNTDTDYEIVAAGLFGQVKFPLTDILSLTTGLRHSYEEYGVTDKIANSPENREYFQETTGNIVLDATFEDLLVYAGVSTGFKSGALNALNPTAGITEPEEITSIELGFKYTLAEGRYNLNGALFTYDYENAHAQRVGGEGGAATFFVNAQEADISGLEVEIVGLLSSNFQINAGFTALFEKEYSEFVIDNPCCLVPDANNPGTFIPSDFTGNDVAGAADLSAILGGTYTAETENGSLDLNLNIAYNSGYFVEPENRVGTGGASDDSFIVMNTSVKYTTAGGQWSAALWINNLTDEEYFRAGQVNSGTNTVGVAGQPRHVGLTVGYEF